MKVSMFLPHLGQGGDVTVVKAMARCLDEDGHEIQVNGVPWGESADAERSGLILNRGLAGLVRSWSRRHPIPRDTNVLHAHSPLCLAWTLFLRAFRCRNATTLFTFHWPVPDSGWRRRLKGWLFRRADRCHAPSDEIRQILLERYGVRPERVSTLCLGVPETRFRPLAPEVRREARRGIGWSDATIGLGFVGRLATEKNVDQLFRYLSETHRRRPDLRLLIVGAGGLESDLREQVTREGIEARVHFAGYTREPERFYSLCDLHVLPSNFEAFPLSVVEAAFCEVPTLRSDTEGSRDQIREGETGFLYPVQGGYSALKARLDEILESKVRELPPLGKCAREHCLRICRMSKFQEGCRSLFSDLNRKPS